ncbi:serine/threonine-protein kinase VRK1 isoform X2 [Spea bombifrons]|uniref:serine/threonine-protein kinase VRK1 isoform X2 n=1 Tax=Spea bombifrons TaxID=233779 RepID=UPI00234ABA40|nr:serine/threonine-protein kinase VRK1 isoform X2 [Spea bombifrons]
MPPRKKPDAAGGRKAPAKRKLAEEFPPGEVLTDSAKKQWKLGLPVGQGGFGRLYLADVNSSSTVGSDAPYVIKVEPSDNGPLFSELKFYMRAAKPELIQKWTSSHKLKYLGVPRYWGSGLHEKNGNRFMVMDRLGKDLQKVFEETGKLFPHKTVLQLGLRVIDILEYIHEHEYVHGDIKASNLLLHHKHPDQVFLVDYGLTYRYCPEGVHKEYKEDPRKCHNGTIEFTSVDAHKGVSPSRRGDLEILGYCMIQWLCGKLPWEDNLTDPSYVTDSKIRYGDEILTLMEKCFPGKKKPDEIGRYMELVKELGYSDQPSYQKLRDVLLQGLKALGAKDDGKLDFSQAQNGDVPHKERKRKITRSTKEAETEETEETEAAAKKKPSKGRAAAASSKSPSKPTPKGRGRGRGQKK